MVFIINSECFIHATEQRDPRPRIWIHIILGHYTYTSLCSLPPSSPSHLPDAPPTPLPYPPSNIPPTLVPSRSLKSWSLKCSDVLCSPHLPSPANQLPQRPHTSALYLDAHTRPYAPLQPPHTTHSVFKPPTTCQISHTDPTHPSSPRTQVSLTPTCTLLVLSTLYPLTPAVGVGVAVTLLSITFSFLFCTQTLMCPKNEDSFKISADTLALADKRSREIDGKNECKYRRTVILEMEERQTDKR